LARALNKKKSKEKVEFQKGRKSKTRKDPETKGND
jgi:hypothetical protein